MHFPPTWRDFFSFICKMENYEETLGSLLAAALKEDVGDGDYSSLSCIPANAKGKAILKVKQDTVIAGIEVARRIFDITGEDFKMNCFYSDGSCVEAGDVAFEVEGNVQGILRAERLLLNCMQRMSGIATLTRKYVDVLKPYRTRILDTRKTTPNFRLLEKEAVKIGGGYNHRFGLYDMIMLKDNHIDFAGGIENAVNRAHDYVLNNQLNIKIEVEARSLADVQQILAIGEGKVFRIMLDNFEPAVVAEAVKMIAGRFETEASGGINLNTVEAYAQSGVDYVSVGGLIHQAQSVDLSLKAV